MLFAGFTLVEMLVVLLVISVLVLLFIPNVATQREKATRSGDKAIIKVVETQIEMYKVEFGPNTDPGKAELISEGYLEEEQWTAYLKAKENLANEN